MKEESLKSDAMDGINQRLVADEEVQVEGEVQMLAQYVSEGNVFKEFETAVEYWQENFDESEFTDSLLSMFGETVNPLREFDYE